MNLPGNIGMIQKTLKSHRAHHPFYLSPLKDTAIRWDYLTWKEMITLPIIAERFIPILSAYKEITSEHEGGMSIYQDLAQKAGQKKKCRYISGKTIVQYLTYIQETTSISGNIAPQNLSSSEVPAHVRHARPGIRLGCLVAKVLGDTIHFPPEQFSQKRVRYRCMVEMRESVQILVAAW